MDCDETRRHKILLGSLNLSLRKENILVKSQNNLNILIKYFIRKHFLHKIIAAFKEHEQ